MSEITERLVILALAVCAASCASVRAPAQTEPPSGPAGDGWHLKFHMSGGFAGFDRTLEVDNTGSTTATDRTIGMKMTMATAKELAEITAVLMDLKPLNSARDANCRDCIEYSVDVLTKGGTIALHFDDTAVQGAKMQNLVEAFTRLLDRVLAGRSPA